VGKDDLPLKMPYRHRLVEVSARTGKRYEGGQQRWELNRSLFNQDVFDRWRQPLDEPGSWWLTDAALGQCELYLRELTNEGPQKKRNPKGREVTVWEKIDNNVGNHFWDTEIIARAMAVMVTGGEWDDLAKRAKDELQRAQPRPESEGVAAREHPTDYAAR